MRIEFAADPLCLRPSPHIPLRALITLHDLSAGPVKVEKF